MIPDIQEINLPQYATLCNATVTLQHMAEKTITSQVRIDGDITPDFSYDWVIVFKGEKYIMPLRKPQAKKTNTSRSFSVDLTFHHWAIYWLKKKYFFQYTSTEAGTVIPDKYIVPLRLNLGEFCSYLTKVCEYWYGDKIRVDLNPVWKYDEAPTGIDISYSVIWDVITGLYDNYAVSWYIAPDKDIDHYVIKVGYPSEEISHIFEYGFKGGLLEVERQVQDENINNMLLGRGGEKNLPYRYFKDVDPDNPSFPADPDWIPELRNIYFTELRGKSFRDYIRGWKTNPHRQLTEADGTPITPYPHDDTVKPIEVEEYDEAYGNANFAYFLGHTDEKFDPVEYVADKLIVSNLQVVPEKNSSIDKYGELPGALENNSEIYPSIQGVTVEPYGRVDEAVDVEQITSDDVPEAVESDAQITKFKPISHTVAVDKMTRLNVVVTGEEFSIPSGQFGDFDEGPKTIKLTKYKTEVKLKVINSKLAGYTETIEVDVDGTDGKVEIEDAKIEIVNSTTGEIVSASGIPEGTYRYYITFRVYNQTDTDLNVAISCEEPKVIYATPQKKWVNKFDIYVKNIWGTQIGIDEQGNSFYETEEQYASRVWKRILGDHIGNDAKVVFSDGMLSTSEDYEFIITEIPAYDKRRCKWTTVNALGETIVHEYDSEWRISLAKSSADLESTGLYVPSTMRQGKPGDHFFFIGIDMPHQYILWAEQRLDEYKTDQMSNVSDIKPTWVVTPDRIRLTQETDDGPLLKKLNAGDFIRLADKRLILNSLEGASAYEKLFIQSITYTYREPTTDDAALNPDIAFVLSDKYMPSATSVTTLQGEVNALAKQVGSISNVEQIVRIVGDKLYLRKDGMPDRSMSPSEFASLLTSVGFRTGIVGGAGWGIYIDENGRWVVEADRFKARQDFEVNNFIINQVSAMGGYEVSSVARMEVSRVIHNTMGRNNTYICYFDQKNGSIANLFQIGDIALSQVFDSHNTLIKYYRRVVKSVGVDYIELYGDSEASSPQFVSGNGVPAVGDVIVHYGNIKLPERGFVKVRDVVGGGYERYIEGLNSVSASGNEYFFVGRQEGTGNGRPRFYLGDTDAYIEWIGGKLVIKGELHVESVIGDTTLGGLLKANEYLHKALPQSTIIAGGLILSTLIQLGYTGEDNVFSVLSGINGSPAPSDKGGGISYWAGGKMLDKGQTGGDGAACVIRMDGSAYFANNVVRFDNRGMGVGEYVALNSDGIHLSVDDRECVSITNTEIDTSQYSRPIFNENIHLLIDSISPERLDLVERTTLEILPDPILPASESEEGIVSYGGEDEIQDSIYPGIGINPSLPQPDQIYVNLKREWSRILWTGVNQNTMTISISGEVRVALSGAILDRHLYTAACIDVINEGEIVKSQIIGLFEQSRGVYTAKIYIQGCSIPNRGNVSVRLTLTAGKGTKDSLAYGVFTCDVRGDASHGAPALTLLGRNGIAFCRGDVVFAANEESVIFKAGHAGLQITNGKILKTTDGENWRSLEDFEPTNVNPATISKTDLPAESHFVIVKNSVDGANIALPRKSSISNALGIIDSAPFVFKYCVMSSKDSTASFRLWGRNSSVGSMNNSEYPERFNNNASSQSGYLNITKGAVYECMLVFDGTDYYAQPLA